MKGGYVHNSNHFTGKKSNPCGKPRKKKVKVRHKHHNKYDNVKDNIILVDEKEV